MRWIVIGTPSSDMSESGSVEGVSKASLEAAQKGSSQNGSTSERAALDNVSVLMLGIISSTSSSIS